VAVRAPQSSTTAAGVDMVSQRMIVWYAAKRLPVQPENTVQELVLVLQAKVGNILLKNSENSIVCLL